MRRFQLFEFGDLGWFPSVIRDGGTDYLRFIIERFNIYKPAFAIVKNILNKTGDKVIIDLCSRSGGPAKKLAESVLDTEFKIVLTDKFPNTAHLNY